MNELKVYKASAGSGKTYTLAVEYIERLMSSPRAYRHTLAVTFTNKATQEMKQRILANLYGLSHGLPSTDGVLARVAADMRMSPEAVRAGAAQALDEMLQYYHMFRVQTIDSFFQSVLRNLARELGLPAGLRTELNQTQVSDEAVDEVLAQMKTDKALAKLVAAFTRESLEDNDTWNVTGDIKDFARNIFAESYKRNAKELKDTFKTDDDYLAFRRELKGLKQAADEKYKVVYEKAMGMLEEAGLTLDDLRSNAFGYFLKLSQGTYLETYRKDKKNEERPQLVNSTIQGMLESPEGWITKPKTKAEKLRAKEVTDALSRALYPFLVDTEESRKVDATMVKSAEKTLENLNTLRLLARIDGAAKELNHAQQRFVLGDTQHLLGEMIGDDDVPFVYERIGARLRHVMIDEFQDTSRVQWHNFRTLLLECMSHDKGSMLVGDVKQSIYRWREGDWRLLNDIEGDIPSAVPLTLDTNYRSAGRVVEFNNMFFEQAVQIESGRIEPYNATTADGVRRAYADVRQRAAKSADAGYVEVRLLPQNRRNTDDPKESELMLDEVLGVVERLLEAGASESDIAILIRRNKDAVAIAACLRQAGHKVVSTDAFTLGSSPAVQAIVSGMYIVECGQQPKRDDKEQVSYYAAAIALATGQPLSDDVIAPLLARRKELQRLTLHDLAGDIMRTYDFNSYKGEAPYLSTLFDTIDDYCRSVSAPTLRGFLKTWDRSLSQDKVDVAMGEGLRMLTIHKSKGLQYRHVILPFASWEMDSSVLKPTTLWLQRPEVEPFKRLPVVPVKYTGRKSLQGTIYEAAGYDEFSQCVIDSLNLLYVAFTRAELSLHVLGMRYGENRRSQLIEQVCFPEGGDKTEALYREWGTLTTRQGENTEIRKCDDTEPRQTNVFEPQEQPRQVPLVSQPISAEFRQSNASRRFVADEAEESDRTRMLRLGTVMHQVFASIATADDVDAALSALGAQAPIYHEGLTPEGLAETIRAKFRLPQVAEWFALGWRLYNECAILTPQGMQRPDRVMTDGQRTVVVDFKFGKPHPDYPDQVRRYMELLTEMGMPAVEGWLWYVNLDKFEKLKLKD